MSYQIITTTDADQHADILLKFDTEIQDGFLHSMNRSEEPSFKFVLHAGRMRSHSDRIMLDTLRGVLFQANSHHCSSVLIFVSRKSLGFTFTIDEMEHLVKVALRESSYRFNGTMTAYLVDEKRVER